MVPNQSAGISRGIVLEWPGGDVEETARDERFDACFRPGDAVRRLARQRRSSGARARGSLSLTAQHPTARVDKSLAGFRAATNRLFPDG
jgi:hypothetical protein